MNSRMAEFLQSRPIAIAGASADRSKYGNIVLRTLRERGMEIFAVNPRGGLIEDEPVYPTFAACPRPPALAVMVTPPPVTLQLLIDAQQAGIPRIWFQDGSFDEAVLQQAARLGLETVHDACIMVMAARLSS